MGPIPVLKGFSFPSTLQRFSFTVPITKGFPGSFPSGRDSLSFPFTILLDGKLLEMRENKGNGNGEGNREGNKMKGIWLEMV